MKKELKKGLYLVVDPGMEIDMLTDRLTEALQGEVVAVQIWDNFPSLEDMEMVCLQIKQLCNKAHIPVILNNRWHKAIEFGLDGVHFDGIPAEWPAIKDQAAVKGLLVGLTVNNDLQVAEWAVHENLDYVSFCSMFPSVTANSCDLVAFESVKRLTELYDIPVFLAGGIRIENVDELNELDYYGIAVVSGVMGTESPRTAVDMYLEKIKR